MALLPIFHHIQENIMLDNKIRKIIKSFKLDKSDKDDLDRLLDMPEIQAILSADENNRIESRKALINELKDIPPLSAKLRDSAAKKADLAFQRFKAAEKEFLDARAAFSTESLASHYSDYKEMGRAGIIERELIAGADPRIADYHFELCEIKEKARHEIEIWPSSSGTNWLGKSIIVSKSNLNEVTAICEELTTCLAILKALQLLAVTAVEITMRLNGLSDQLKAPLAKLQMNPPTLDENNQVIPPLPLGANVVKTGKVA